jgi:hypothetical protein
VYECSPSVDTLCPVLNIVLPMLCAADYVDENGELIDDIVLPQGAPGKDEMGATGRGSTGGMRRGSKSSAACAAEAAAQMAGFDPSDMFGQAALAASLMQQGALQVQEGGGGEPYAAGGVAGAGGGRRGAESSRVCERVCLRGEVWCNKS